ncbi:MAG TPA: Do family serine endopeptidase [Candidatus Parabacteroides intestinigallinarum]|mgnify:CR=1 FL=1|uniref:Do family serine endopeptidase n=1 Tax=Candidatus Parabacteroides intestinigallinarum TaxID=2838722 RepID=A0A9D1XQ59_9BACT|nr:Do family serine endopeptidase [Candidatus Parabacteroides intestinigallinarum]
MKTIWKNVLGVAIVAMISSGVAIGTSTYLMNKNQSSTSLADGVENTFKQSYRLTNFGTVAAENTDFTAAAESAVHGVVHIKATTNAQASSERGGDYIDPFEYFFGFGGRGGFQRPQPQPRVGAGSGVIISTDGYIITNNHVIEGADELEVTLNDNRKFPAKVIGTDPTTDIALIKIEANDLPTIPFGDSEKLKVGEWVLAVGNPFNLTSTVTAGIVSAKSRGNIGTAGRDRSKIESFIQTDAAVNPGNSGGALVNTKGELVGINTAIYSETGNFAGYSFAVPISIAGKVANDLKQYGAVQRAVLGVLIQDPQYAPEEAKEKLKVFEGAYVGGFAERSSAKEAGIEEGDVVVAVNGVKIKSSSALQEQISKYRPGDKVELTVNRNGDTKKFTVELRNAQGSTKVVKAGDSTEVMGGAFKTLSKEQKRQLGVSYGIEVTGLTNGKLKDAGIKKGFIIMIVNNQRISSPDDLEKIVEDILQGRSEDQGLFIKGFYPNGRTRYYAIDLAE